MTITVIKSGYSIIQILIGKPTAQIIEWIRQLNDNPLYNEEVTYSEEYCNKSLYELAEFLNLK